MAQSGYTPIQLYYSTTAAAVPTSGNLASGELGINITDGKLYYKNNSGVVTLLASSTTVTNSFSAGSTGFTPSTATTGAVTLAGTLVVGNGGTGQTTLATGALGYGQGTSAHASLAIGTAGQILTVNSGATAPQWSTLSGVAVTTFSAGTTGFTPSSATAGAVTLAGTLATTNGGTGLTSFTSGGLVYASSTSALTTGSSLYLTGTTLNVVGTNSAVNIDGGGVGGIGNTFGVVGTSYGYVGTSTATPLVFNTGNTERMRLDTSGNLGIGVTPTTVVDVLGSIFTGGSSRTNTATKTFGFRIPHCFTATNPMNVIGGLSTTSNNIVYIGGSDSNIGGTAATELYFYTAANNATANGTERLRITSTGAFGLSGANYGTSGQVLTSGGSGAAPTWATSASSQWTTSGTSIYYSTGNVGINTSVPGSKLSIQPGTVTSIGVQNQCGITIENGNGATTNLSQIGFGYTNTGTTTYVPSVMGFVNTATAGSTAGALFFATREATTDSVPTERMRIDAAGRVGIATTAQTTNLARLQVTHDPSTDRYGIYVPGGSYVGSGPSGNQYGGYFVPHVSNSTSGYHCGVYGSANSNSVGAGQYGGYFDGQSAASTPVIGVYGAANQSDTNGPGTAYGGYFYTRTSNPTINASGATITVRAENTANQGSRAIGVYATTMPGATNIYGYQYDHNGSLQFRVKSNGGIDNYSSNDSNLSDLREKKDFAPAKAYLATICSIPVQTFKYIDQADDLPTLGVVAQDVQAVAPELVTESDWGTREEPRVRLSIYETDLTYALMKSIQELNAKFETLKTEFDEYKASHP